ncbi:hypothetical protein [Candidatus Nitrospira bockiana]
MSAGSWEELRSELRRTEPAFYELTPGGALGLSLGHDGWMLEVTPDGRVICQTGMDMDDIKSLLSDGTAEDLGTDELAKQAKFYLQPTVSRFRKTLLAAGFEERTEMTDEYVAVLFQRTIDLADLDAIRQTVGWCRRHFS